MALNWRTTEAISPAKAKLLTQLFHAGVERGMDSLMLCQLAGDAARASPHDQRHIAMLGQVLIKAAGDAPAAWSFLSQSLRQSGETDRAMLACEKGLELDPTSPDLLTQKAQLLMLEEDFDRAAQVLTDVVQQAPRLAAARYCECLIRLARHNEARSLLEQLSKQAPLSTALLSYSYVCDVLDGDCLHSPLRDDNLIDVSSDAVPFPNDDMTAFHSHLRDAIIGHGEMRHEPGNNATKRGSQGFLERILSKQLHATVVAMIQEGVEKYVSDRERQNYAARAPVELGITAWAVALQAGGYQAPHTHSAGWLSGVYYVDVEGAGDRSEGEGGIEFWQPPGDLVDGIDACPLRIGPKNGMMILFPSYVHHGTIPCALNRAPDRPRISIAFDIG